MRGGNQNKIASRLESLQMPYRKDAVWEQLNSKLHGRRKRAAWIKYAAILFLIVGSTTTWFMVSRILPKPPKASTTGMVNRTTNGTVSITRNETPSAIIREAGPRNANLSPRKSIVAMPGKTGVAVRSKAEGGSQVKALPDLHQADNVIPSRNDISQATIEMPIAKTEVLPKPRYRVVHANELYQPAGKKQVADGSPGKMPDETSREAYAVRKKRSLYIFTCPSF